MSRPPPLRPAASPRRYPRCLIVEMEEKVLAALGYKLTVPTAHAFLVRIGTVVASMTTMTTTVVLSTLHQHSG